MLPVDRWNVFPIRPVLQRTSIGTGFILALLVITAASHPPACCSGEVLHRSAKETLTAVELNHGDQLQFMLRCGRTVSLVLEDTRAAIVERVEPGGIVYQFCCDVRIDGQPITLRRYVCSQESFYQPYVVSGLRIWPDTVRAVLI